MITASEARDKVQKLQDELIIIESMINSAICDCVTSIRIYHDISAEAVYVLKRYGYTVSGKSYNGEDEWLISWGEIHE